mmetsp:Transcript_41331/g.81622  ORF Transcript_41331/g.81622 Transcript_41331/m.81622 type:complete len:729 (+) Transcript_41331:88-2274(+)
MQLLDWARTAVAEGFEQATESCGADLIARSELREHLAGSLNQAAQACNADLPRSKLQQRQRREQQNPWEEEVNVAVGPDLCELTLEYSWEEVLRATDGFSGERRLGSGASGTVFRGTLEEGIDVAVKVIEVLVGGGFEEEVRLLSRCRHPNVVMLLGFARENNFEDRNIVAAAVYEPVQVGSRVQSVANLAYGGVMSVPAGALGTVVRSQPQILVAWDCLQQRHPLVAATAAGTAQPVDRSQIVKLCQRRALIYELLPGGDAHARIQARDVEFPWRERLRTALGMARGLAHLHKHRPEVFHRDIKTANVLFGLDGTAKIADFGLACASKYRGVRELAVACAAGTPGYADPLYSRTGIVTEANEIYSLGMVFLELLTGRPPAILTEDGSRCVFLWQELLAQGERAGDSVMRLLDQRAGWPPTAAASLTAQALRCISSDPAFRPSFLELASLLQDLAKTTREAVPNELTPAGGASVEVASPQIESSRQLDDGAAHCKGTGARAQATPVARDAVPGGGSSGSLQGTPIQIQQQPRAASEEVQDFRSVAAPPPPPAGRLRPPQPACLAAQSVNSKPPLQQHTSRSQTPQRASFIPPILQASGVNGTMPAAAAAAATAAAATARVAAVRAATLAPQKPTGATVSASPGVVPQRWQQPVSPQRPAAAFPHTGLNMALAPRALPLRAATGCPGVQLAAGIGGPTLAHGVAYGQPLPIANAPVMPVVRVPQAVYGR